jgi:hypothetical protein
MQRNPVQMQGEKQGGHQQELMFSLFFLLALLNRTHWTLHRGCWGLGELGHCHSVQLLSGKDRIWIQACHTINILSFPMFMLGVSPYPEMGRRKDCMNF